MLVVSLCVNGHRELRAKFRIVFKSTYFMHTYSFYVRLCLKQRISSGSTRN